jgi:tRNA threonylcarbamoyladenosine biosynthesis protein TsaE
MKPKRKVREMFLDKQQMVTSDENETYEFAEVMGSGFQGKEVVCLTGELGAGKTVFAKGISAGLGLKDVNQVCSPSFSIINIYQADCMIYHVDLYRLGSVSEVDDLGLEDYLDEGVIIIEWAEKMKRIPGSLWIEITILEDDKRLIKVDREKR